jgi:dihydrofolate synthase/folylpolyglutamate synthase
MAVAAAGAVLGREPSAAAVQEAIDALRLPARFEQVASEPAVIVDGSHNPQAAHTLATAIGATFGGEKPLLLLGMLDDKDAGGFVAELLEAVGDIVVTRSDSSRSVPVGELAAIVSDVSGVEPNTYPSVEIALDELLRDAPAGIVVTGSLTIAAEARRHLLGSA